VNSQLAKIGFQSLQADSLQNRNDSVLKLVLSKSGETGWRREMKNLVRYRAMESLCRQAAVHQPLDSWRMLAEAEMWHHKALEEIATRFEECNGTPPAGPLARTESAFDGSRLLAG
jgi:hypothetical protein